MSAAKKIQFGIMIQGPGNHMHAWKDTRIPVDASVNIRYYQSVVKQAEAVGFTFAFIADGLSISNQSIPHFLNRFEPLTLLSALASVTSYIGLVGTLSTTYSEPFTVARQFASLDMLSGGRAGWNLVTSPNKGAAANYNKGQHPDHAERYRIAEEYLEVVQGLWHSWEDGAFVRDRETGQFFDEEKMHTLDHNGEYFSVKGPLNIARSPQGQPVIFQAGASESGKAFAAANADAVFTNAATLEEAKQYYKDVKGRAEKYGRQLRVFPGIQVIGGETLAEAEEKYKKILSYTSIDDALLYLGRFFDHFDFRQYPLDEPFPDIGDVGKSGFQSTTDGIKQRAEDQQLTLRETALQLTVPKGEFFGTYEQIANKLIEWIDQDAADGFIFGAPILAPTLEELVTHVLPILEEQGYYSTDYKSRTLRENLGLTELSAIPD
ncbi:LLM class flavin-dependent oxidoreductase [Terribacillus saccharophilus]|uniref:LLM class flavin-dependent oxidoreductase n=1 Tax=Terribacillus saccharophilus TaxID=361277 RepID=UPI000BA79D92|nr:LLM class flavin-dependent oxidoreductase [Terribacillus saccharophilus]PAF18515.1 LLM class flavin-dependent oxidoreductase [Terribacillus saccharophilus]